MGMLRIAQDGDHVCIINEQGALILRVPWSAGLQIAAELHRISKVAESYAHAEILVADASFLRERGGGAGNHLAKTLIGHHAIRRG